MRKRSWTDQDLRDAVKKSLSYRRILGFLNLKMAGGSYNLMRRRIRDLGIDTSHFKGQGWNKGLRGIGIPRKNLDDILVRGSNFQSFKLKRRLFQAKIKPQHCEECGWAQHSDDGRLPLELDHINGDSTDNRLVNLRVLCPNCHSLKPTHRGANQKRKRK